MDIPALNKVSVLSHVVFFTFERAIYLFNNSDLMIHGFKMYSKG